MKTHRQRAILCGSMLLVLFLVGTAAGEFRRDKRGSRREKLGRDQSEISALAHMDLPHAGADSS